MTASPDTGGGAIAYLVLAHTAPRQLARLVAALASPSATVFVHLDAKSDARAFIEAARVGARWTRERVAVRWGDFSQVEAILVLLREAYDDPREYERFVLVSGVDHPLRTAAGLTRFFAQRDREYMNLVPMPDDDAGKPISKLTTFQLPRSRTRPGRLAWTLAMAVVRRVWQRDVVAGLRGLVPYGGSTWWAITRDACECILTFPEREPDAARFFRHAVCPDESYFQTAIGNSPLRASTEPNVTFTDWADGGANPAMITDEHLPELRALAADDATGPVKLFARKFADGDGELVRRLDEIVSECEPLHLATVGRPW